MPQPVPAMKLVQSPGFEARASLRVFYAALTVFFLSILGCHEEPQSATAVVGPITDFAKPADARVVTCSKSVWPRQVRTQGSLVADEEAVVSSKVAGRVARNSGRLG